MILLGRAFVATRRYPEGVRLFQEAAELARRLGDTGAARLAELYLLQQRFTLEADL